MTTYRKELYGNRADSARQNFRLRRGSLGVYNIDELPETIAVAYSVLKNLQKEGRLFVEQFHFPGFAAQISEVLSQGVDYSGFPTEIRDVVKTLHESLGGEEIQELFRGKGIMSIRTGAPIPKPKRGQKQKDILILAAHPDDAEIAFGAQALHEMVVNRSVVHYFVLFPGTAGGDDRGYTMEGSPIIRAVELIAAARKMGIPWVHFFTNGETYDDGFPVFGLREWLGALALDKAPEAAFLLGLALARTFVADEIWSHIADREVDWHIDHYFAGLMADAFATWGQWTSYMSCLVDTRKRIPDSVLRIYGVVWEYLKKLPVSIRTTYIRETVPGRRLTSIARLIIESLTTHKSQNGENYAWAKLDRERGIGIMDKVNEKSRPSNEVAYAVNFNRDVTISINGAVGRYARARLAFIKQFDSDMGFILAPVEDEFTGLTD